MADDTIHGRDIIAHLEDQFGDLKPRATGVAVRILAKEMHGTEQISANRVSKVYRAATIASGAADTEAALSAIERIAAYLSAILPTLPSKAEIAISPRVDSLTDDEAQEFSDFHTTPAGPTAQQEETYDGWPSFSTHVETYQCL